MSKNLSMGELFLSVLGEFFGKYPQMKIFMRSFAPFLLFLNDLLSQKSDADVQLKPISDCDLSLGQLSYDAFALGRLHLFLFNKKDGSDNDNKSEGDRICNTMSNEAITYLIKGLLYLSLSDHVKNNAGLIPEGSSYDRFSICEGGVFALSPCGGGHDVSDDSTKEDPIMPFEFLNVKNEISLVFGLHQLFKEFNKSMTDIDFDKATNLFPPKDGFVKIGELDEHGKTLLVCRDAMKGNFEAFCRSYHNKESGKYSYSAFMAFGLLAHFVDLLLILYIKDKFEKEIDAITAKGLELGPCPGITICSDWCAYFSPNPKS